MSLFESRSSKCGHLTEFMESPTARPSALVNRAVVRILRRFSRRSVGE